MPKTPDLDPSVAHKARIDGNEKGHSRELAAVETPLTEARPSLTFSDVMLLLVGVAAVYELITHDHGLAAALGLFGGLTRVRYLLAERLPRWPNWVSFAIVSVIFWVVLYLAY